MEEENKSTPVLTNPGWCARIQCIERCTASSRLASRTDGDNTHVMYNYYTHVIRNCFSYCYCDCCMLYATLKEPVAYLTPLPLPHPVDNKIVCVARSRALSRRWLSASEIRCVRVCCALPVALCIVPASCDRYSSVVLIGCC